MQKIVSTKDGSKTMYSNEYKQHYHNIDDGAIFETLSKHIKPAFSFHENKKELNILDICFGLGYNSFYTIYYVKKHNLKTKINIYSPELDKNLVKSLENFEYPKELDCLKEIIKAVSKNGFYKDEQISIYIQIDDARKYLKNLDIKFDIIYQDAFSSEVNYELWTKEYFDLLFKLSKEDTILTTYSIATPVRLAMNEAGFYIYEYIPLKRKQTLAFIKKQEKIGKFVDMQLKKQRNPSAQTLYDKS